MKTNASSLAAALLLSAVFCHTGRANTLDVSVSGQFSSAVTATALTAPDATWLVNFSVPDRPAAANPDSFGFDSPFTAFSYKVNNVNAGIAPASIRFATGGNFGLFTLFFGPESGFDSNGNAIPEFSFQGPQAFSGATTSPAILPGTYTVSDWIYSDALNYDEHAAPAISVVIAAGAPEPAAGLLVSVAGGVLLLANRLRPRSA